MSEKTENKIHKIHQLDSTGFVRDDAGAVFSLHLYFIFHIFCSVIRLITWRDFNKNTSIASLFYWYHESDTATAPKRTQITKITTSCSESVNIRLRIKRNNFCCSTLRPVLMLLLFFSLRYKIIFLVCNLLENCVLNWFLRSRNCRSNCSQLQTIIGNKCVDIRK